MAGKTQSSSTKTSNRKSSGTRKSSSGTKRSTASRSRSTKPKAASRNTGVVSTAKSVAGKAAAPAAAVGAAAAAVVGGLALKNRSQRKTVLGVSLPKSVDGKAIVKSVGQASKRFARTSKTVSKDLDRAGDKAERIGKILD